MKDWKFVKLSDVSESIQAGGTPRRNVRGYWDKGTISWLKISDLKQMYVDSAEEKITEKGLKESSAKLFPKGAVLYTIFATLGEIAILNIEATTNQAIAGIVPNNRLIDTKYLYYCLKSERNNILKKKSHATQDNINLGILRNHEIPLPLLPVQKQIVTILERAENLKEKRELANDETDEIIQALFYEMFGDPIKNDKKWEKGKLEEIAEIIRDSILPKEISSEDKYVGLEHIEGQSGDIITALNAKEVGLKSNKFVFDEQCVLYGKLRPYLNKVALPNFKGICSTDILPIKPLKNKSNKYFIAYLLKNPYYIKKATEMSTGANLPRISPNTLSSFVVYMPPIDIQNRFALFVKHIKSINIKQKQSTQDVNQLFDALMQKAFAGELVS